MENNNIKNLIKLSIAQKSTDFKKAFDDTMQNRIINKINSMRDSVGKAMFNKGE